MPDDQINFLENKMNAFIIEWTNRIAMVRATGDDIDMINVIMDFDDSFTDADDGSDEMHFFYMDTMR